MKKTLKACGNIAYGFNHRVYNHDDYVLKGRSIFRIFRFAL